MRNSTGAAGDSSDWRDRAACLHHDPDLFFPEGTAGPALRQADQAKQICQACQVRTPCVDFALRHGLGFGIWGGATREELPRLRVQSGLALGFPLSMERSP